MMKLFADEIFFSHLFQCSVAEEDIFDELEEEYRQERARDTINEVFDALKLPRVIDV